LARHGDGAFDEALEQGLEFNYPRAHPLSLSQSLSGLLPCGCRKLGHGVVKKVTTEAQEFLGFSTRWHLPC